MNKEELIAYLKENLEIQLLPGKWSDMLVVKIKLEDITITEDYISLDDLTPDREFSFGE